MNKLYICKKWPELSMGGRFKFSSGRFETSDADQQAIIENSESFKSGKITWTDKVPANAVRIELPAAKHWLHEADDAPLPPEPVAPEPEPPAPEPEKKFLSRLSKDELVLLGKKNGIEGADELSRADLYTELKKLFGKGKVVAGLA